MTRFWGGGKFVSILNINRTTIYRQVSSNVHGKGQANSNKYTTFHKRYLYYLSPSFPEPTYCYCFVKIEKRRKK